MIRYPAEPDITFPIQASKTCSTFTNWTRPYHMSCFRPLYRFTVNVNCDLLSNCNVLFYYTGGFQNSLKFITIVSQSTRQSNVSFWKIDTRSSAFFHFRTVNIENLPKRLAAPIHAFLLDIVTLGSLSKSRVLTGYSCELDNLFHILSNRLTHIFYC